MMGDGTGEGAMTVSETGGGTGDAPVWTRVKWTRAAQVAPLLGDDHPLLPAVGALPPPAAFDVLRAADAAGAVHFVAQSLARIDAARWMADCLADVADDLPPPRAVAAKAVRRWVANPSDEARRLAYEAGALAGWQTIEGTACLAIYFSGGSLAPAAQEQPVHPPAGLFGQTVAGAVLMAAFARGPADYPARIAAMLDRAAAIAAGLDRAAQDRDGSAR